MATPRVGFEDTLNFTTSLCLTYVLLAAILRSWVRRTIHGFDDYVVVGATLSSIACFATSYVALKYNAGKPWTYINGDGLTSLSDASLAGVVTFIIAHFLSKCSVVAFLLRITKDRKQILLYRVSMGVCAVVGIASILIVTVGLPQTSGYYWDFYRNSPSCNETTRWDVFTALDILTELGLLGLPIYQVWPLQMPRSRKLAVIGAFWLRLPVIGLSIGRMVYTDRLCNRAIDIGLDSSIVMMWMQVELTYGIMATTFCALRAFTMSFNSNLGMGFVINAGPESYTMSRLGKSGTSQSKLGSGNNSQKNAADPRFAANAQDLSSRDNKSGHYTQISTHGQQRQQPAYNDGHFKEGRSSSSERGVGDGTIHREVEYTVQHSYADEMPILSKRH